MNEQLGRIVTGGVRTVGGGEGEKNRESVSPRYGGSRDPRAYMTRIRGTAEGKFGRAGIRPVVPSFVRSRTLTESVKETIDSQIFLSRSRCTVSRAPLPRPSLSLSLRVMFYIFRRRSFVISASYGRAGTFNVKFIRRRRRFSLRRSSARAKGTVCNISQRYFQTGKYLRACTER